MNEALTHETPVPAVLSDSGVPDESFKRIATIGWVIVGVFFGVLGTWAALAPLKGAVIANAVIKVDGNRKSVQHLEGGIVKELRVKEGDKVTAGDILVVLDESQARAERCADARFHRAACNRRTVTGGVCASLANEVSRGPEGLRPIENLL